MYFKNEPTSISDSQDQYIKQQNLLYDLYIQEKDLEKQKDLALQMMALRTHFKQNVPQEINLAIANEQDVKLPNSQMPPLKITTNPEVSSAKNFFISHYKITPENFDKYVKVSSADPNVDQEKTDKLMDHIKNDPKKFAEFIAMFTRNMNPEPTYKQVARQAGLKVKKIDSHDKVTFEFTKQNGDSIDTKDLASLMKHGGMIPTKDDVNKIRDEVIQMQNSQQNLQKAESISNSNFSKPNEKNKSEKIDAEIELELSPLLSSPDPTHTLNKISTLKDIKSEVYQRPLSVKDEENQDFSTKTTSKIS